MDKPEIQTVSKLATQWQCSQELAEYILLLLRRIEELEAQVRKLDNEQSIHRPLR